MSETKPGQPTTYEKLRDQVRGMNRTRSAPSDEERADWAYGNAKMENEDVTREMARQAVKSRKEGQGAT